MNNEFQTRIRTQSVVRFWAVTLVLLGFNSVGCMVGSQSPNPIEFIKDPLGIDRGINEYYIPPGQKPSDKPRPTWGSQIRISPDGD